MTTKELQSQGTVSAVRRFGQIGKGIALAGAIAALSLTTPTPAYAGGNGVGAAIGLGILGGPAGLRLRLRPAASLCLLLPAAALPGLLRPGTDLLRHLATVLRLDTIPIEIREYRGRDDVSGLQQEAGHRHYWRGRVTTCS
jgi:hypothetical protein